MASISSLSGTSSTSSIYGSRNSNIISGLASGLDTESMIEGMLESYKQKISGLQQDRTQIQWKQEAYQSISDKLVEFSRKYMSYTSSTNLLSSSFFNNSVITTTGGKFADMVYATGKTSSTILIDAVAQLATAARYASSASGLNPAASTSGGKTTISGSSDLHLDQEMNVSTLEGSLTLSYGKKDVTIDFGELEFFDTNEDGTGNVSAEQLKDAIAKKLEGQTITTSSGDQKKATELIDVQVDKNGQITFTDKANAGNDVSISGATGKLKDTLGLDKVIEDEGNSFTIAGDSTFSEKVQTAEYLSDKSITVTLDGTQKTISLESILKDGDSLVTDEGTFSTNLQAALDKAFGAGKVTASLNSGKLSFTANSGSSLAVSSTVGDAMGIGDGISSYLNTTKSLGDLGVFDAQKGTLTINGQELQGRLMEAVPKDQWIEQEDGTYKDAAGYKLDADGYRLSNDGERLYEFDLTINDVKIGTYTQDTALNTVMNGINSNTEAGVNVSYSKLTDQFVFTAKETGEGGRIEIGEGLGTALFGKVDTGDKDSYTAGQDAIFQATINGETMNFSRSSNTFDMDGMSVTLNGLFNNAERTGTTDPIKSTDLSDDLFVEGEAVSFTSKADTDTIVDAIKTMVEDYNAIVEEVKKAYSTMPLTQSNGSKYEPLTDDDKADMSESEIEAYEEKAKTGLLFADSDMSSLYNALRNAVTPGGSDGSLLRSIGINTSYSDGLTTITLDESALREALETDLDQVKDVFTKSKDGGAATDGLMTSIETIVDRYARTTGDVKGILIEKAGSKYSPTAALDNTFLNQMEEIDDQISTWQSKMSDQVDYYTNKFTQLELLIQQMNSQSSTLAGLMGG